MKKCINDNTCIHRRGCKRWVGNLSNCEEIVGSDNNNDDYVDDAECMRSDDDKIAFDMLIRFRLSTGEKM